MSGLNRFKISIKVFNFVKILFPLLVLSLIFTVLLGPYLTKSYQVRQLNQSLKQTVSLLENASSQDISLALQSLNHEEVDIIVIFDNHTIYTSNGIQSFKDLTLYLNESLYALQEYIQVPLQDGMADVWIGLFHPDVSIITNTIIWIYAIQTIMFSLLLTISIYTLINYLLRTFKKLQNTLEHVSEFKTVDLDDDQVDGVNEQLNLFIKDLEQSVNQFTQKYSNLEIELQQDKQELELYKKELLSFIHDIKTPINVIQARIEFLKMKQPSTSLDEIEKTCHQMLVDINQTLIKSDMLIDDIPHDFDAIDFLYETMTFLLPLLDAKDLAYEIIAPRQLLVHIPKYRFSQIFNNAISNAIKYAPQGSLIEVSIEVIEDYFTLSICNDYDDVSQIDFDHAFSPFYQFGNQEGAGFGMSIIQELTKKLDGQVTFKPTETGVCLSVKLKVSL